MSDLVCERCGANVISGYQEGSDPNGPPERVCPNCQPDHPFSVAAWNARVERDPLMSDKLTIEIYGHDLPSTEVWAAVSRFVHETFSADWKVDLIVDDDET